METHRHTNPNPDHFNDATERQRICRTTPPTQQPGAGSGCGQTHAAHPARAHAFASSAGSGNEAPVELPEGSPLRSMVAEGMHFVGNAQLRGPCSVAGQVEGNLTQAPDAVVAVVVTETGRVKGDITARKISVMGHTDGILDSGEGEVALHDTASVHGLVRYGRIQVNGADLNATLERVNVKKAWGLTVFHAVATRCPTSTTSPGQLPCRRGKACAWPLCKPPGSAIAGGPTAPLVALDGLGRAALRRCRLRRDWA